MNVEASTQYKQCCVSEWMNAHQNLLGVDSGFVVGRQLAVGVYPAGRSIFAYYLLQVLQYI